jgi:hypothetical protein
MTDLLGSAIAAHGGLDRWHTVRAIDVTFNFSGGLLDLRPGGAFLAAGSGAGLLKKRS